MVYDKTNNHSLLTCVLATFCSFWTSGLKRSDIHFGAMRFKQVSVKIFMNKFHHLCTGSNNLLHLVTIHRVWQHLIDRHSFLVACMRMCTETACWSCDSTAGAWRDLRWGTDCPALAKYCYSEYSKYKVELVNLELPESHSHVLNSQSSEDTQVH